MLYLLDNSGEIIYGIIEIVLYKKIISLYNASLTSDLQPLYIWITDNRMVLNIDKTECMLIGTSQKLKQHINDLSIGCREYRVQRVDTHKLLGLHLDNHLSWNVHIDKLCAKLRSRLFLFNRIKHLLPQKCRENYYSGLVQPLIDYGCIVWGSCTKEHLKKVHRTMKMFARSILNIKKKDSVPSTQLFKILNWMPVDVRIKYFEGVQMYNIFHATAPKYLCNLFTNIQTDHGYNTRSRERNDLKVPSFRLTTGQRSF